MSQKDTNLRYGLYQGNTRDVISEIENILVLCKKSVYDLYGNSKDASTRAYTKRKDSVGDHLRLGHDTHHSSLDMITESLEKSEHNYSLFTRGEFDMKNLNDYDLVITVGGDGTLFDVARYLDSSIPIMGVNSNPIIGGSVGFTCHCTAGEFDEVINNLYAQPITIASRLKVNLNGKTLPENSLNEISFIPSDGFDMFRYRATIDGVVLKSLDGNDRLRSGGVLVSSTTGSTAWINEVGGEVMLDDYGLIQIRDREIKNATSRYSSQVVEIESLSREARFAFDCTASRYDLTLGDRLEISLGDPLVMFGSFRERREEYQARKDVENRILK
jgi:NAD kinase